MNLVCIVCPRGCHLTVDRINDEIVVTGNKCNRAIAYATSELVNPERTLTTTIKIDSKICDRLPVISSRPLPKDKVMDAIKALKDIGVKAPIEMNDIIIKNILGLNVDIIASKSVEK